MTDKQIEAALEALKTIDDTHSDDIPPHVEVGEWCWDEVRTIRAALEQQRVPEGLTFKQLREANIERYTDDVYSRCQTEWQTAHWLQAMVGEVGELANILKKIDRGDFLVQDVHDDLRGELADIQTYLDLLAFKLGVNLGRATTDKFNEVSERIGSDVRLAAAPEPDYPPHGKLSGDYDE